MKVLAFCVPNSMDLSSFDLQTSFMTWMELRMILVVDEVENDSSRF